MSHTAIAAVLARTDLSMGERLVTLSLASFANREGRAFPGNAAAAARAGLGRSRYLEAREQLVARGLLAIESAGRGRGQATTLITLFAQSGPWWDGEINAPLLEQVLSHSPVRGPARLVLATLAALANESGVVEELSTDELCRAAGLANSTYRRARSALLACGEVELVDDGGGRGRLNRWRVTAAAGGQSTAPVPRPRRRAPVPGQPPLLSPVRSEPTAAAAAQPRMAAAPARAEKGPDLSGVRDRKGPELSGVTGRKGPILSGVSPAKGPDLSGVCGRNPAKTPPETPPPHAPARREPPNPGTRHPPNPPEGGSTQRWVTIEERYVTNRGRRRRRSVHIDLDEVRQDLDAPSAQDLGVWRQIRGRLQRRVGASTFDIWLDPIALIAVDNEQRLVLAAPAATAGWTSKRFGRLLSSTASEVGRHLCFANEAERHAFSAGPTSDPIPINHEEAAG